MPNRFLTGFLFFKSGAEGCASWIYQAGKKDPYNDFDGSDYREAKDAMIVYPSPKGPVPTLQWEGIREGSDDYRYLYTLGELIEKAKDSPDSEKKSRAQKAAQELGWR